MAKKSAKKSGKDNDPRPWWGKTEPDPPAVRKPKKFATGCKFPDCFHCILPDCRSE